MAVPRAGSSATASAAQLPDRTRPAGTRGTAALPSERQEPEATANPPRRDAGPCEVRLREPVEARAAEEDVGGDVSGDSAEQIRRHVRKVGIEMGVVGRNAHAIGTDEPRRGFDLRLAPLDRRPAVASEVFPRRERQVGCMGVTVLRIVPLDPRQNSRDPRVLGLEKTHPESRVKLEDPCDDHRDQRLLHLNPVAGDVAIKSILPVEHVHVRVPRTGPFCGGTPR